MGTQPLGASLLALGAIACAAAPAGAPPDPLAHAGRADLDRLVAALDGVAADPDPLARLAAAVHAECGAACACLDAVARAPDAAYQEAVARRCPAVDGDAVGDARWRAVALAGRYVAAQARGADDAARARLAAALDPVRITLAPDGVAGEIELPRAHGATRRFGARRYVVVTGAGGALIGELPVARVTLDGAMREPGAATSAVDSVEALARRLAPASDPAEEELGYARSPFESLLEADRRPRSPLRRLAWRAGGRWFAREAPGAPAMREVPSPAWWTVAQAVPHEVPPGEEAREALGDGEPVLVLVDRAADAGRLGEVLAATPGAMLAVAATGGLAALPRVFGASGFDALPDARARLRVELGPGSLELAGPAAPAPRSISTRDAPRAPWVDAVRRELERATAARARGDGVIVRVRPGVAAEVLVATLEAIAAAGDWVVELEEHVPPTGAPTVALAQPSSVGELPKDVLRAEMTAATPALLACYEAALVAAPDAEGTVSTQYFISPRGEVVSSNASGVTPGLAACVAGVVKAQRFPAPGGGGGVQVNYPVRFAFDRW